MKDVIELTETWGCRIVVCGNAETVCDSYDIESSHYTEEEATTEACEAASEVILRELGDFPDTQSFFPDWHGGKYARASFSMFWVVAEVYHREPTIGELEDPELAWTEWEWTPRANVPAVIRFGLEEVLSKASDAMRVVLQEIEKNVPDPAD